MSMSTGFAIRATAISTDTAVGGSVAHASAAAPAQGQRPATPNDGLSPEERAARQRVIETASQENVYTLGMRGLEDDGMDAPAGTTTVQKKDMLQNSIIPDQRQMISAHVNPNAALVPQVFVPYKEALLQYQAGLQLPDDVTLVWPDDNHGYIRQLSNAAERAMKSPVLGRKNYLFCGSDAGGQRAAQQFAHQRQAVALVRAEGHEELGLVRIGGGLALGIHSRVGRELLAFTRELLCTGQTKAFARSAHDCLSTANS